MKSKLLNCALSASLLGATALSPTIAFAAERDSESLCDREARTFEEWVAQIFLCR